MLKIYSLTIIFFILTTNIYAKEYHVRNVFITAYSLPKSFKTSSGKHVRPGMIAISRDIREKFKLKFGDKIIINGIGSYIYEDWMPNKWIKRMDIYIPNIKKAKIFGKKIKNIKIIKQGRKIEKIG